MNIYTDPISRIMFVYQNLETDLPYFRDLKSQTDVFRQQHAIIS